MWESKQRWPFTKRITTENLMPTRRKFIGAASAVALTAVARNNPSGVTGYDYRLPSFKKGARLLFQGDSITDMKWGRNQGDRNHYLGHSYVYLIAARLGVDMPEAELDIYNRGMSGHTVGDLRKRWQKDAIDMKPDLLSILIGINDVGRSPNGVDTAAWEADYRHLLESSRAANPDLRIVLLDPFVLACGRLAEPAAFKKKRDQVDRLLPIVARLASDFSAVHIKTQDVFDVAATKAPPEQWIWDGIHPLPQGHELIARNWLQQVSA
ncbi:MAG: lysophospholipase L1-like esterase [Rhodothermales bacterium]|jgi:lysophospholipase L1-like esterase